MNRPETSKLYTFKVYPEHFGENPLDDIETCLFGYPFAVSPLHNMDKMCDGELIKPHYHINIIFRGAITLNSAISKLCKAFDNFGGDIVGNFSAPDSVQAARGKQRFLDRYLCHLDHKEKHQYDTALIYCSPSYMLDIADNDYPMEAKIVHLIFQQQFVSFAQLVGYCTEHNLIDELHFIVRNSYFVKQLL